MLQIVIGFLSSGEPKIRADAVFEACMCLPINTIAAIRVAIDFLEHE